MTKSQPEKTFEPKSAAPPHRRGASRSENDAKVDVLPFFFLRFLPPLEERSVCPHPKKNILEGK